MRDRTISCRAPRPRSPPGGGGAGRRKEYTILLTNPHMSIGVIPAVLRHMGNGPIGTE